MSKIPYISGDQIERILKLERLLPVIQEALEAYSKGPNHPDGAVQPIRGSFPIDKNKGKVLLMPAYFPSCERAAVKIASIYPENSKRNLPNVHASVTLLDATTGQLLALLEGNSITELRTAAASAVATRALACKKSTIVAVIGAGAQGSSHARAMYQLLKPSEIRIWSRTSENAQKLVSNLQNEGIPALFAKSVEDAVRDADVINTCTCSSEPLIFKEWIKDGSHINAVGAPLPNQREVDPLIMKSHHIFCDSLDGAFSESGDIIQSGVKEVKEIGEVLASGNSDHFRGIPTLFKNLGMGVEDLAAANLVYEEWKKLGL